MAEDTNVARARALDTPFEHERDDAGLLGYDNGNGVVFF